MSNIHPSAVIEEGARVDPSARVGPFSVVGAGVTLGADVDIRSHVVLAGKTQVGEGCTIYPFACVGEVPQDLKYDGEPTRLEIGPRSRIREHVTVNTGTAQGGGVTRVGADCLLMAGCHVAHDTQLGDGVIVVNQTAVAGHCIVGDDVIIGGLCGIHQFVRIGRGAIIGALSMVTKDVIPYGLVQAPRGELDGLNLVGLKRRGVSRAEISQLRAAFQTLAQGEGTFHDRAQALSGETSPLVAEVMAFVLADTDRHFLTPR